jgi:hypothetical protein
MRVPRLEIHSIARLASMQSKSEFEKTSPRRRHAHLLGRSVE